MASDRNIYVHVPSSGYPAFETLLTLSDKDFDDLVSALRSTPPVSSPSQYAEAVASALGKEDDREDIEGIVDVIISLFYVRESARISTRVVIDETMADIRTSRLPITAENEPLLRERIGTLLEIEESLGVVAKAVQLWGERERVFQSARIVTDIRPIFTLDTDSDIETAMIIHTLSVEYREGRSTKTILFALDSEDVPSLRDILDRAESKAKTLSRFLRAADVRLLEDV